MTANFVDQFGFNDEEFSEHDENIKWVSVLTQFFFVSLILYYYYYYYWHKHDRTLLFLFRFLGVQALKVRIVGGQGCSVWTPVVFIRDFFFSSSSFSSVKTDHAKHGWYRHETWSIDGIHDCCSDKRDEPNLPNGGTIVKSFTFWLISCER